MKMVIGENRYKNWFDIGAGYKIIDFSFDSVSCLNVLAQYESEKEKEQLETMLFTELKLRLQINNVYDGVVVEWKEHPVLKMPYIQLRYASDLYEIQIIKKQIEEKVSKSANALSTKSPTDDEEEDIS